VCSWCMYVAGVHRQPLAGVVDDARSCLRSATPPPLTHAHRALCPCCPSSPTLWQTFDYNALETLLLVTSMFILLAGMTFQSGVTSAGSGAHTALTVLVALVLVSCVSVFVAMLGREVWNSVRFARRRRRAAKQGVHGTIGAQALGLPVPVTGGLGGGGNPRLRRQRSGNSSNLGGASCAPGSGSGASGTWTPNPLLGLLVGSTGVTAPSSRLHRASSQSQLEGSSGDGGPGARAHVLQSPAPLSTPALPPAPPSQRDAHPPSSGSHPSGPSAHRPHPQPQGRLGRVVRLARATAVAVSVRRGSTHLGPQVGKDSEAASASVSIGSLGRD
jgi:hypothetical protein